MWVIPFLLIGLVSLRILWSLAAFARWGTQHPMAALLIMGMAFVIYILVLTGSI